jgi:hypothetical protein
MVKLNESSLILHRESQQGACAALPSGARAKESGDYGGSLIGHFCVLPKPSGKMAAGRLHVLPWNPIASTVYLTLDLQEVALPETDRTRHAEYDLFSYARQLCRRLHDGLLLTQRREVRRAAVCRHNDAILALYPKN